MGRVARPLTVVPSGFLHATLTVYLVEGLRLVKK